MYSLRKELILGLDASFPPMGFTDKKQNIVGFDIDLAKEVTKRMGIKLKITADQLGFQRTGT